MMIRRSFFARVFASLASLLGVAAGSPPIQFRQVRAPFDFEVVAHGCRYVERRGHIEADADVPAGGWPQIDFGPLPAPAVYTSVWYDGLRRRSWLTRWMAAPSPNQ